MNKQVESALRALRAADPAAAVPAGQPTDPAAVREHPVTVDPLDLLPAPRPSRTPKLALAAVAIVLIVVVAALVGHGGSPNSGSGSTGAATSPTGGSTASSSSPAPLKSLPPGWQTKSYPHTPTSDATTVADVRLPLFEFRVSDLKRAYDLGYAANYNGYAVEIRYDEDRTGPSNGDFPVLGEPNAIRICTPVQTMTWPGVGQQLQFHDDPGGPGDVTVTHPLTAAMLASPDTVLFSMTETPMVLSIGISRDEIAIEAVCTMTATGPTTLPSR